MRRPRAILICVGSELLRGKLNTHTSHISRRLGSLGLALHEDNTVGDDHRTIARAIRRALNEFEIVLVSGGLGPTFDDLTREAAAEATGLPLELSQKLLIGIKRKFRKARYRMPDANTRQAYLLRGAKAIDNAVGTAPGQWVDLPEGHVLVLLPGPPAELHPMLETFVLPRLAMKFPGPPRCESHLHFVGVPESVVDDKVRPIIARASRKGTSVQFTILAHQGLVDFDVFVSGTSSKAGGVTLNRIIKDVRKAVGRAWYGSDRDYPLEKVVGDIFRQRRATLAIAESCTGGLLAARLTEIPGSSDYFRQGIVTYSNTAKIRELGVPKAILDKYGAVSPEAAEAMARGIRQRAGTTWGVGITGIAGPGGGTRKKPVGLVYIALASKYRCVSQRYIFNGDRGSIRQRTVVAALDLLRQI